MAFDIKEFVTKKEGPLPVWAWVLVGAGGWLLIKRLRGSNQQASTSIVSPQPAYAGGGGGGSTGGSSGSSTPISCPSGFHPDPTGTICLQDAANTPVDTGLLQQIRENQFLNQLGDLINRIPAPGAASPPPVTTPPSPIIAPLVCPYGVAPDGTCNPAPAPVTQPFSASAAPPTQMQTTPFNDPSLLAQQARINAQQAAVSFSAPQQQMPVSAPQFNTPSIAAALPNNGFIPQNQPVGTSLMGFSQGLPVLKIPNALPPGWNPFGPTAPPQLVGPSVPSATFGSGTGAFKIGGHYVGDPNNGGAVWVPD